MICTERSEPPSLFRLWVGISVIASCLKRKCVVKWGTLSFYPNMYVVLVAPSGKCRKGTAMDQGYQYLRALGIKMAAESITREALIQELQQSNDTQVDPVTGKMYLHASLTVYSQELTVFLGYNNTQLMSDLTDWYDCRSTWTYRTKHQGTDEIIGVWVNLIGATTPELLQTALPRDAIGGGLTSRMIFIFETKKGKTIVDPFESQQVVELRDKLVRDLERIHMLQGEFKVTEDFIEKWATWYHEYDNSPPPFEDYRFSGYFERRPTHIMKLASILCASRTDSMLLDKCDFDRALGIIEQTEKKMPYVFSGVGKYPHSEMLERLMAYLTQRQDIPIGELYWHYRSDLGPQDVEILVRTLEKTGMCTSAHVGGTIRIYATEKLIKRGEEQ